MMRLINIKGIVSTIQKTWPLIPAAIYLLGFLIIVLTYLVGLSFTYIGDGRTVFPYTGHLFYVLNLPEFREALNNTFFFVLVGTPLELIFGLWLALMLYQSFPARNVIRSILIIPLAIPTLVTATLLFILFDYPGGHINHLLMGKYSIIPKIIEYPLNWRGSKVFSLGISMLGKVWRDTPISMLILLSGLNTIDPELTDAAKTLGTGWFQRLRHLTLPLIMPSISAVVLLRSIEMWKEFIFPFILAGRYDLLGTLIESLYNNWGHSESAAVVALILVICIIASSFIFFWFLELFRRALVRF